MSSETSNPEPATILLVDDQERNLDALEAILDQSGYQFVRARSAEEALLALLKGEFAAIVCDIKMPGIGGIELARMIKHRKRTQHIPILFLTAHLVEEADLIRGYGVGAVDYLSKPISPDILRFKLGVFVELFRKTRALAAANKALADEVAERQRAEERLRVAKEELEMRVQERTAELTSANRALRESEDRMVLAKEAAESANRAKDHFLAVLSHELRTPLTPVLATVQAVLRSQEIQGQLRDDLDLINRNVELEARLIDDLLDLTRIARGKMELSKSVLDIHSILEHALRTCAADFESNDISIRASLAAKEALVLGDRSRLLQVFWNLLKNAAKFTQAGGNVEVRTLNPADGTVRIEVADSGIGIEAARLHSIFDAFEQGSAQVTRRFGGLGLGLSIGKALVDLHGGKIAATSEGLNQGSVFTVDLPLNCTPAMVSPAARPLPAPAAALSNGSAAGSPRLLLVEDHPDTSHVMERLLRGVGYDVTTANGVTSAIRAFEAAPAPFNVVVSDIGLPDGNGLDLMRELRVRFPNTPGVALSGFGMEDDRKRSTEAGFSIHLTKPIDFDVLRYALEQVTNNERTCPPLSPPPTENALQSQ